MSTHSKQWKIDRFFKGFMASMVLKQHTVIDTSDEAHQRRFEEVAKRLRQAHQSNGGNFSELPQFLAKSQITGRYKDWDDALISLQTGLLSAQNPYYLSVKINCSQNLAETILHDYSPEERALLDGLVTTFWCDTQQHETAIA
jgi:hypothetical protein